jgi:hypothetical protein
MGFEKCGRGWFRPRPVSAAKEPGGLTLLYLWTIIEYAGLDYEAVICQDNSEKQTKTEEIK